LSPPHFIEAISIEKSALRGFAGHPRSISDNLRKAPQQNYLNGTTIMKTIFRIMMILAVAAVVAGAFSLAVNNSSSASSTNEGGSLPAMTDANGQAFQPMELPGGGDREGGSIAGGLAGVLGTLAKLTGISILVLLIQKACSLLGNRGLIPLQQ
jgi:hypothetical protein